jgi:hypothetical protein
VDPAGPPTPTGMSLEVLPLIMFYCILCMSILLTN